MNEERRIGYKDLLSEKQYLKNVIAATISRFGDSIDSIAFTWMVYALTGSASLSALTYGVNILVTVVMQPFIASLISNWNKKAIIVTADLGRGALVTLTAILYFANQLQPWMLILFTGLMSFMESFRNPAGTAVYPHIISKEKYTVAMSLSGSLARMAEIGGLVAAGAIIGIIGVHGALFIDAATFIISALVLSTLKLPAHKKVIAENPWKEYKTNTKEGFSYIWNNKLMFMVCTMACALNCMFVPISTLQAPYVSDGLRLGPEALAVLGIATSAGMIIGSLAYPFFAARFKRYKLLFVSLFGISVSLIFMSGVTLFEAEIVRWITFILTMFFGGFASAFANNIASISFMEHVEGQYLTRASGIMSSMCLAAMPVMSFLIALLVRFIAVVPLMFIFGIAAVIISILFSFVKILRNV